MSEIQNDNFEENTNDDEQGTDVYFNVDKIFSISSFANILSWFFLVFAILFLIPFVRQILSVPDFSFQFLISALSEIVINLSLSLLLLFFFVLLRAISEGLLVLLEIEDNTRPEDD